VSKRVAGINDGWEMLGKSEGLCKLAVPIFGSARGIMDEGWCAAEGPFCKGAAGTPITELPEEPTGAVSGVKAVGPDGSADLLRSELDAELDAKREEAAATSAYFGLC
jgi:hypothetical protein